MFEQRISEDVHARVLALQYLLETHPFKGMLKLVPAYASLAVFYDFEVVATDGKGVFDLVKECVEKRIEMAGELTAYIHSGELVEVPVIYEGEDLEFVAGYCGLTVSEVIERHTSVLYRVYMLGFLPGFAYLGGMDPALNTPRKTSPRLKVPAGSVGIAGLQTGIYPLDSPGGWQLIGHTSLSLFDPMSDKPVRLQPGDQIRFRRKR